MFKTSISSTPFTTEAANNYFTNITGGAFGNDCSFLATLRALVAPRIKEGESVNLVFGSSDYTADTIRSVPADRAVMAICNNYDMNTTGQVIIHSLRADSDSNLTNMKIIVDKFVSVFAGYHRLEKFAEFYRKSFAVDCYINPELKSVIIFADNLDIRKMHYLQVSILAFLPWYLNQQEGITEDELALVKSLREKNSEDYERCLAKLAERYDFRTARIRQLLKGFETRYEQVECDRVRQVIQNIDREITRLNDNIGEQFTKRNEQCIRLLGLEQKVADGGEDSEIMEYFLCNTKLVLERVTNTDMYFTVKDCLEYFDRDMAEQIINRATSFVYRPDGGSGHTGAAAEKMKKLMTEIFVSEEPRLRIRVCASYRFDLNGSVAPNGHRDFGAEYGDYLPNPHINDYNCMGNYTTTINRLLRNHDYIGALEQCVASCKSLNWGDSAVMTSFMRSMWGNGNNNRCIELPDGRIVKPNEAISWLEQQETQANE